jgi:ribosomal protein L11 methyltransferase
MIDALAKRRRFERVLDLGCGSGVLALAAAKVWRRPVLATDIDPWAVHMTREHAELNRLAPWLTAVRSDGFNHPAIRAGAPYDLIVANILARPLQALAQDVREHIRPGGRVVLAGLLNHQERQVLAAYRNRGMVLERRLVLGEWTILALTAVA